MTARSPSHAAPVRPSIFRLSLRMPWRKPAAAPALPPAGAATPAGGTAVLGDRMLSEVRTKWDVVRRVASSARLSDAEIADLDRRVDALIRRPVNGVRRPTGPLIASPTHPPWPTAANPVLAGEPPVPFKELNRRFSDGRPTLDLMREVLAGLMKL